jgi:hypothetical protein
LSGECAVNTSTNELVLKPYPNQTVVRCIFFFADGTTFDEQVLSSTISLPAFTYLEAPIQFIPTTTICKDQGSNSDCEGYLSAPINGMPFLIKTTSLMTPKPSCTQMVITEKNVEPYGGGDVNIYTYSISMGESNQGRNFLNCDISLKKSQVSPYFYYFRQSTTLLSFGQSRDIIFSLATVNPVDTRINPNCHDGKDNQCTLIFELDKHLLSAASTRSQIAEFHFSFPEYFIIIPDERLVLCPSEYATSAHDLELNNLWCLTVRKPLELLTTRENIPDNIVTINIVAPLIQLTLELDITAIEFTTPVWFEYDDYCIDEITPFCGIIIQSKYQGPPMTLTFSALPFDNRIEYLDCWATTQMYITTSQITFPSKLYKNNGGGYVRLPPGSTSHMCVSYTAIAYKTVYPNDGELKWVLNSQLDGLTGEISRDITPKSHQPLLGGPNVQFRKFPIQMDNRPNCLDRYDTMCTIAFYTFFDPSNQMSWMRSFDVYIPGVDSDFMRKTIYMDKYLIEFENFRFVNHVVTAQILPANIQIPTFDHTGSYLDQKWYFSINLSSEYYAEGFWEDSSKPTVITLTFRKAPDSLFRPEVGEGIVPYFLSYAQSPLSQQPTRDELFFTPEAKSGGLASFVRPNYFVYTGKNCDNDWKFNCRLTLRRWTTDKFTYFLIIPQPLYKNVPLESMNLNFVFLNQDMGPIDVQIQPAPGIGAGYVFKVDVDTLPISNTGVSPDGAAYTDYDCYFTRQTGLYIHTVVYFFDFAFDPSTNLPYPIRTPWQLEQPGVFETDALPTFHDDCGLNTDPFCTITYTFNDNLPPNWVAMEHPLPDGILDGLIADSFTCSNIAPDVNTGDIPSPTISLMSPGTTSLHNTTPRDTPWIRVENRNTVPIMLTKDDVPFTCTIILRLLPGRGPQRQRLNLWTIHTIDVEHMNLRNPVFVPDIAWSPVQVTPSDDCRTTTMTSYACTLTARIWGSDEHPVISINNMFGIEAKHPLFQYGTHKFYSRRLTIEEQLDPENDKYMAAYLEYGQYDLDDPRVIDGKMVYYDFWVLKEYQEREFLAYHTWTGPAVLGEPLGGIYPQYDIYLDFNGMNGDTNNDPLVYNGRKWNKTLFQVPATIARQIIQIKTALSRYSGANDQYALQTMNFELPLRTMRIESDYGVQSLPCIGTTSTTLSPSLKDFLPLEEYLSLLTLSPADQVKKLEEYHSTIFKDPTLLKVPIMGYFERKKEEIYQGRGLRTSYYTEFTLAQEFRPKWNVPGNDGPIGLTCMWYLPINSKFPSAVDKVKHTIKLDMPDIDSDDNGGNFNNEDWFHYHSYPTFITSAQIDVTKKTTTT